MAVDIVTESSAAEASSTDESAAGLLMKAPPAMAPQEPQLANGVPGPMAPQEPQGHGIGRAASQRPLRPASSGVVAGVAREPFLAR